jgi:large subunit ribosomal protein L1
MVFKPKMVSDLWKRTTTDDVYPVKYYRKPLYTFEEAIEMHRETHHPTVYNQPDAFVKLFVECNLRGEKKVIETD